MIARPIGSQIGRLSGQRRARQDRGGQRKVQTCAHYAQNNKTYKLALQFAHNGCPPARVAIRLGIEKMRPSQNSRER
ncbi:hypothetical protein C9W97_25400 [Salmonella enterica subsp. enterica serovar Enteritidis]|nr:hypothetical protein [Salmonella enterica subsp. enterica serovar Enteritidis]